MRANQVVPTRRTNGSWPTVGPLKCSVLSVTLRPGIGVFSVVVFFSWNTQVTPQIFTHWQFWVLNFAPSPAQNKSRLAESFIRTQISASQPVSCAVENVFFRVPLVSIYLCGSPRTILSPDCSLKWFPWGLINYFLVFQP